MNNDMRTFEQIIENLSEGQKELLADTIFNGAWGSTELYFDSDHGFVKVWGFITDFGNGTYFKGNLGNRFRSLFKALRLKGDLEYKQCKEMTWIHEYWVGGKSSLFFRDELAPDVFDWANHRNGIDYSLPDYLHGRPYIIVMNKGLVGTYDNHDEVSFAAGKIAWSLKADTYRQVWRPFIDAEGNRCHGYEFRIL